jgi:alpha-1,2-mannosyltransferase
MYFVTLAYAYAMEPASLVNPNRTRLVTLLFAIAAIVGWPFALATAIPFVFEELFLFAGDIVPRTDKNKWMITRWIRLLRSGAVAGLMFVCVLFILFNRRHLICFKVASNRS